jgi:A nuclease of the HNH/ENDO VII superfamily with conserved WHH
MARPGDWDVLDLAEDPTPGSPGGVRSMARRLGSVGDDAADCERGMRSLAGDQAVLSWVGLAGDVFRGAIDEFPDQLHKLADSYDKAESALSSWATDLESAQAQADRALVKGRAAKASLDSLQGQLSAARSSLTLASTAYGRAQQPGDSSTDPDPDQVRAALRSQQGAQSRVSGLESGVGDAQADLDLARRLALDAKDLRGGAVDRTAARIDDAAHAGIPPNSFWEDFTSAVAKVWHVVVVIAKIAVVVLGVVALVIGGPIAWVVFAAALVILADTLIKLDQGKATWGDVAWAVVGCIPGTKGLTSITALKEAKTALGLRGLATNIGRTGMSRLQNMARLVRTGPTAAERAGALARARALLGGKNPINAKYAGTQFPLSLALRRTYPRAVRFSEAGFPQFHPHSIRTVVIDIASPTTRAKDFKLANEAAGLARTPKAYVWHHAEDGRTMELIPRNLHQPVRHTGGVSVNRHAGIDYADVKTQVNP